MKRLFFLLLLICLTPLLAQVETDAPSKSASERQPYEATQKIAALKRLQKLIRDDQQQIEERRNLIKGNSEEDKIALRNSLNSKIEQTSAQLQAATEAGNQDQAEELTSALGNLQTQLRNVEKPLTDEQIKDLNGEIAALKEKQDEHRLQFEELATGVLRSDIEEQQIEPLSLEQELRQVFSPLLEELKKATEESRELDLLYEVKDSQENRQNISRSAVQSIEKLLQAKELSESLKEQLLKNQETWLEMQEESTSTLAATQLQIDQRESEKQSAVTLISNFLRNFFKSRGWNLLLAILIFSAVYFVLKRLTPLVYKLSPVHKKGQRTFFSRIVSLLYVTFTLLVATVAALITLYLARDWVLLSLLLLILLGIFWGLRAAIPPMIEQIKLILNIGPVREDERIIHEGIPWKVEQLGVYCKLVNPELSGGLLRLPARILLDQHSRPYDSDEIWFPTSKGSWVILSDETYGKVLIQTPEYVQLLLMGGALKTYPVGDFLALSPQDLSKGFRLKSTFGIDYNHQSISTTEVPAILRTTLTAELTALYGDELINNVNVEFASAAASSLDYEILTDLTENAAEKYQKIRRSIQSICVDICNQHNWGIPFQQITIHKA